MNFIISSLWFRANGIAAVIAALTLMNPLLSATSVAEPVHAIAMHGEPLLKDRARGFGYARPNAPKGGRFTIGLMGTFDSLNPFIIKGNRVGNIGAWVYETLMVRSYDEPFTLYSGLARTVETPSDRSWVEFSLDERARFSDGAPVTADDVLFSWELLKTSGRPNHRRYYAKVVEATRVGPLSVRFAFADGTDRELPLIMGLMPVLPRHAIDPDTFESTSLAPPIGSGAYEVVEIDAGNRVLFRLRPDYWARNNLSRRGHFNFNEIEILYFKDSNSLFESFKKGQVDYLSESEPGRWMEAYDFPAVREKRVIRREVENGLPKGMYGFVFNTRRSPLDDIRVREALTYLFDFEWINKALYYGLYSRTSSFFHGSELSSFGRPADAEERKLLKQYDQNIRADVLDGAYRPPVSDGSGRDRKLLRAALKLLDDAGYRFVKGALEHRVTGKPLSFEVLVRGTNDERLALAFSDHVKRAGVDVRVRLVDSSQYQKRRQDYDFDIILNRWYVSLSPGNEQAFYWGSDAADRPGTRNYMGAKSPAIDAMIKSLLKAKNRDEVIQSVRSLDRALLSGLYVLPLFHNPKLWFSHWAHIGVPDQTSLFGYVIETWWHRDFERNN